MSEENVEVIRSVYGEFGELGAGDPLRAAPDQIDRVFRHYLDDQFEAHLPPDYPEGEPVFRGREGINQLIAMLGDTWGKWRYETEHFFDAGDRGVVVFLRVLAEGEASHVPIEVEAAHVWTIRGGRAASMHVYRDRSQALEAVGLRV
jgi:ketosteroid isomerase-like protein